MTWRRITGLFVFGLVLVAGLYDLFVYLFVGNQATISKIMLDTAEFNPIIMIATSFLMGGLAIHLFDLVQHVDPTPQGQS
jgi:hypothetical protein